MNTVLASELIDMPRQILVHKTVNVYWRQANHLLANVKGVGLGKGWDGKLPIARHPLTFIFSPWQGERSLIVESTWWAVLTLHGTWQGDKGHRRGYDQNFIDAKRRDR
jgi:hypothetical protein